MQRKRVICEAVGLGVKILLRMRKENTTDFLFLIIHHLCSFEDILWHLRCFFPTFTSPIGAAVLNPFNGFIHTVDPFEQHKTLCTKMSLDWKDLEEWQKAILCEKPVGLFATLHLKWTIADTWKYSVWYFVSALMLPDNKHASEALWAFKFKPIQSNSHNTLKSSRFSATTS